MSAPEASGQPLDELLDLALLKADLALRQKQLSWEKTRHTLCGLATIIAALVALAIYVGSRQPCHHPPGDKR
jgi:hypothetical protein